MRRPKFHFLTVERFATGKSVVTLPGQTFGMNPVPAPQIVKDVPHGHAVARARAASEPGAILFTTTLKVTAKGLQASDILPLEGHGNVLAQDAASAYESLYGPRTAATSL